MADVNTQQTNVVFWHHDDNAERLSFESIQEAVEDYLERQAETDEFVGPTLTVYGFARMKPNYPGSLDWLLETMIEEMEGEFGDPEGGRDIEITDEMRAAVETFAQTIAKEYGKQCWACEQVTSVEIDLSEWERE